MSEVGMRCCISYQASDNRSGPILARAMACFWRHQAITWTNVDFSLLRPYALHKHVRAIPQREPTFLYTIIFVKIILLKLRPHLPETKELKGYKKTCRVWLTQGDARPFRVSLCFVFSNIGFS